MNSINRFSGFQPPVFSEPSDTEIKSEQLPTPLSNPGVASIPDSFENFQSSGVDLSSLTTPMTTQNSDGTTSGESVDASSIFDLITADVPDIAKIDAAIQLPESKWDIIEFLVKESRKTPVDAAAMFNKLNQLTPTMRRDVLTQLSNQDDARSIIFAIAGSYDSGNTSVDLMKLLTQDAKNDPQMMPFLKEAYQSMASKMYTSRDTTQLSNYLVAEMNDLDALPSDLLDLMQYDSLVAGKMMDLNSWEILQRTKYVKNGDPDPITKAYNDRNAKLDSIRTSDPNYYRYLSTYQDWGIKKLIDAESNPQQFGMLINGMKDNNPTGLSSLLATACGCVQNNENPADMTNLIQKAVNAIQNSFDNSSWSGTGTSDEIGVINDMVSRLGDHQQAVNTLSKLPPNILLDLSIIEQGPSGHPEVRRIIDEAMAISKMNF